MTEVMPVGASKRQIAGLDGMRALAVIAVILYHIFPTVFPGGFIGVDIFFVISGFLITTLLLREYAVSGKINLKRFWQRRARRLLPAIIVMISIVSSAALFIHGDILVGLGRQIIGALTFSHNWIEIVAGTDYFDANNLQLFTHFWSLAVEEQFYVVWPLLLLGFVSLPLIRRFKTIGVWITLGLAIGSAVLMAWLFNSQLSTRVYYGTDTHLFGLMIGAALAFWEYSKTADLPERRLDQHTPFNIRIVGKRLPLQIFGFLALSGLIALFFILSEHSAFAYQGGLLLATVLSALVIMAVANRAGFLRRLLSVRILEWIGVRSYGMYLWHWPLFVLLHTALPGQSWVVAGLAIVGTIVTAALSYRYIELPVRRDGWHRTLQRGLKRRALIISNAETIWRVRPHPGLIVSTVLAGLTIVAIVTAPSETRAQAQVRAGEIAIREAAKQVPMKPLQHGIVPTPEKPEQAAPNPPPQPIAGTDITIVGDSVALASAPSLVARFPGILVDAEVSRSMRVGGLEEVGALAANGNLRRVVVVALGTNGYYGSGTLEELMAVTAGRQVVLVTAHGDREWIPPNNQYLRDIAAKYPHTHIADWDQAINGRIDALAADGIHPNSIGGQIYTDTLSTVVNQLQ